MAPWAAWISFDWGGCPGTHLRQWHLQLVSKPAGCMPSVLPMRWPCYHHLQQSGGDLQTRVEVLRPALDPSDHAHTLEGCMVPKPSVLRRTKVRNAHTTHRVLCPLSCRWPERRGSCGAPLVCHQEPPAQQLPPSGQPLHSRCGFSQRLLC